MVGWLSRFVSALILVVALVFATAVRPTLAEDRVVTVPTEDAAINAAIAKARAGLPDFWAAMANPPPETEGYAIKVMIRDGDKIEHFWATDVQRQDGQISAIIANEPETVRTVQMGQRIDVPEGDISDWMFMRKGKIVGNETLRVLLGYMSEDEAAKLKAMFEKP